MSNYNYVIKKPKHILIIQINKFKNKKVSEHDSNQLYSCEFEHAPKEVTKKTFWEELNFFRQKKGGPLF